MTKDQVLDMLMQNENAFVSGQELADALSLSRTAVWKVISQLKEDGYVIESIPNRGYRLLSQGDILSSSGVKAHLRHKDLSVTVFKKIDSTNTALKQLAEQGAPEGTCLIAEEQTAGRGRMGRSFYSPSGSGLYMSLLLSPTISAQDSTAITAAAAVAVSETIEELLHIPTKIKWVNDVYVQGHKVCGILTEGAIDLESGFMQYAIVGIGINIRPPKGGFPSEIASIAGALSDYFSAAPDALRCRLAAGILDRLMDSYEHLLDKPFLEAYRQRSFLIGQPILVLSPGKEPVPATAVEVAPDFSLVVRLSDGTLRHLSSGEVSVRGQVGAARA